MLRIPVAPAADPPGIRLGLALLVMFSLLAPGAALAFVPTKAEGCKAGEFLRWRGAPPTWHLSAEGYSGMDLEELEDTLRASMAHWSEPCCSGFRNSYQGTAPGIGNFDSDKNIMYFEETSWASELGDPSVTLALTQRTVDKFCSFGSSYVVFNAIEFQFRPHGAELEGSEADLLFIATHEFGHWLGLRHTDVDGSVMVGGYTPHTQYPGLGPDDVDGVCTLYPGSCEGCSASKACPKGSVCSDGSCITSECRTTADCQVGTICSEQLCIPGCRSHGECGSDEACDHGVCKAEGAQCSDAEQCADGERCDFGHCRIPPATCPACKPCQFDSDCGPDRDYFCAVSKLCTKACTSNDDCEGNSACRVTMSTGARNCVAPTGDQTSLFCPTSFACTIETPGPDDETPDDDPSNEVPGKSTSRDVKSGCSAVSLAPESLGGSSTPLGILLLAIGLRILRRRTPRAHEATPDLS